jgi:hypothetical protein
MDLYLLQSDIGDDNYFHILDTIGTSWKTYEHTFSTFTGRLASRSGSADPTKGTGFHWHIQADKCLDSKNCTTGTVTIDDILLGGDVSKMVSAPADAIAMPASPPIVGVEKRVARRSSPKLLRAGRGLVEVSAAPGSTIQWIDLSGRLHGSSIADANGVARWSPAASVTGIVLAAPDNGQAALPVVLR